MYEVCTGKPRKKELPFKRNSLNTSQEILITMLFKKQKTPYFWSLFVKENFPKNWQPSVFNEHKFLTT